MDTYYGNQSPIIDPDGEHVRIPILRSIFTLLAITDLFLWLGLHGIDSPHIDNPDWIFTLLASLKFIGNSDPPP